MGATKLIFVLLTLLALKNTTLVTFALNDIWSLDSEIFDTTSLEFAKDISSIIVESILKSKCDGNVFVVTKKCEDYIVHALISLSDWANPVIVVGFKDFEQMSSKEKEFWNYFLSWKRRPCSLIFICDLIMYHDPIIGKNDSDTEVLESMVELDNQEKLGFVNFANFFTSHDQILYFSDPLMIHIIKEIEDTNSTRDLENEAKILKQTGIILSIRVTNRTEKPELVMQVHSTCDFCGPVSRRQQIQLGNWQRNKTEFGNFFEVFDNFSKISFNNSNLNIGYFNYPPHFMCNKNKTEPTTCAGVEWEMISQIGKSLQFNFTLTHIGKDNDSSIKAPNLKGKVNPPINKVTGMVEALKDDKIDLAVGGISVTSERIGMVDFSKVFANEPIVFVVKKPKNIFILGIWLAFQPSVWPLIFLLITLISFLFGIIINRKTLPSEHSNMKKLSLSIYLDPANKIPDKKPFYVQIFESLEITLQPLLGQPLNVSQISSNPRRLLKMILIIWWFSCLIITTLYNTSLITSLINPVSAKEPESLQNLIDSGYKFKLGCTQGSVYELIISATDQFFDEQTLLRDLEQNEEDIKEEANNKMITLLKTIRERLIIDDSESYNLIAYIIEESAINGVTSTWSNKEIGFSEFTIIRERLFLTGYGFALKPQAAYKEKIDTALARLGAGGLIDHWYSQFAHKEKKAVESKYRLRTKLGQIHLNLEILQGAFIFLVFGCSFAGLVFGLEHLTKRYNFRLFTQQEISSFFIVLWTHFLSFYKNHLAQKPLTLKKKKNKFRTVVTTVVMLNTLNNECKYSDYKYLK